MIGLVTAIAIFVLKFSFEGSLWETVFIQSADFLFYWYLVTGFAIGSAALLSWAGDLGVEGARLRAGIATPVAWLMGLPRVAISHIGILLFLGARRILFLLGAFFLTQGVRAVGAIFVRDDLYLVLGALFILAGLGMIFIAPALRQAPEKSSMKRSFERL